MPEKQLLYSHGQHEPGHFQEQPIGGPRSKGPRRREDKSLSSSTSEGQSFRKGWENAHPDRAEPPTGYGKCQWDGDRASLKGTWSD